MKRGIFQTVEDKPDIIDRRKRMEMRGTAKAFCEKSFPTYISWIDDRFLHLDDDKERMCWLYTAD